jgi:uncharacterized tellurite resistance protein B-like protein
MATHENRSTCIDPSLLRDYPTDSPMAQARLVALAMLADGRIDPKEIDALSETGLARLGLTQREFFQVLYDLCADLSRSPARSGSVCLSPEVQEILLNDIADPQARHQTLSMIFDVISSDGRLSEEELKLLRNAIETWQLRPEQSGSPVAGAIG